MNLKKKGSNNLKQLSAISQRFIILTQECFRVLFKYLAEIENGKFDTYTSVS